MKLKEILSEEIKPIANFYQYGLLASVVGLLAIIFDFLNFKDQVSGPTESLLTPEFRELGLKQIEAFTSKANAYLGAVFTICGVTFPKWVHLVQSPKPPKWHWIIGAGLAFGASFAAVEWLLTNQAAEIMLNKKEFSFTMLKAFEDRFHFSILVASFFALAIFVAAPSQGSKHE